MSSYCPNCGTEAYEEFDHNTDRLVLKCRNKNCWVLIYGEDLITFRLGELVEALRELKADE